MPIDKRTPRVLNSDADSKTLNKVSMEDALNLYSGPDNEGILADGSKSDSGDQILKNIKGNLKVPGSESLPGDARLIGSVEDVKTDITYLFVYSGDASNQGVWAYDKRGKLPGSNPNSSVYGSLRLVYKSSQFKFPQNGFVKGDVVYSNAVATFSSLGDEFDKDAIIYFTDGINEPRKINAYRAIAAGSEFIYGDDIYAEADFITACPKTPLTPITFFFDNNPEVLTNNFVGAMGFQFAYQNIYIDGIESSVSTYSEIAFPPSVINQGAATFVDHNPFNVCRLSIPVPGPEVKEVRILCRQGETGSFLTIDQLPVSQLSSPYSFSNDKVLTGFSQDEINKQFDSVPRKAKSQAVSSNRLFYSNYLDGFNNQDVIAKSTVVYKSRKEDFKSFNVGIQPSIAPVGEEGAKTAAFVIDCSDLESTIESGTTIDIKITLSPDRNWHAYRFSSSNGVPTSYHQSTQMGPQSQESVSALLDGANSQTFFNQSPEESGSNFLYPEFPVFGNNGGLGSESVGWKNVENSSTTSNITYGTSAGNPLIIKGGGVTFRTSLEAVSDISNAREAIAEAIKVAFAFTFNPFFPFTTKASQLASLGFIEIEGVSKPEYTFNAGLTDGEVITQGFLLQDDPSSDLSKLITMVGRPNEGTPYGAVILNSATVTMSAFQADESFIFNNPLKAHIGFNIRGISNPEFFTCIHETPSVVVDGDYQGTTNLFENVAALSWVAISQETISNPDFNLGTFLSSKGLSFPLGFSNISAGQSGSSISFNYRNQVGHFVFTDEDDLFDFPGFNCLLDGEGGPGGSFSRGGNDSVNEYDKRFLYQQGSVTVNPQVDGDFFFYGSTAFFGGTIVPFENDGGPGSNIPSVLPLIFSGTGNGSTRYPNPQPDGTDPDLISGTSVNFKRLHPYVEVLSGHASIQSKSPEEFLSFKSDATHDFGIVYYDERGRHGFVNPIDSVYVAGYSPEERNGNNVQGKVEIEIEIESDPPSWAHYYKVVYAKNTTVKDFIQYSSGGAFISRNEEEQEIAEGNTNVYVSLNYLQGHPISYVSSFGARTPEGGLNFYKFEEGDKLKVISYAEGSDRKYPKNIDFEVVGQVKLGDVDNPLSLDPSPNEKGDFLILKNNPNAGRFSYSDVVGGTDSWGDNCIMEIRTPFKNRGEESRVYFEISDTYKIVFSVLNQSLIHQTNPLQIKSGDVIFRKVAVNVRDLDGFIYEDIIQGDDGNDDPSAPNFKSVYLETNTATDLYSSKGPGAGRPNAILKTAKETVREATITYSEPSNPEGTKINYSSFNSSLANFKDLPERFGGIQYMGDRSDSILVIQKDKVSKIPVNRSVLSDAGGNNTIIASRQVLNEAVFYYGQSGCDTDPSSVFDSGEEVYFCNKSLSKVYRFTTNNGIEEISSKGMSSMIRAALKRAIADNQQVRVIGGYDPLKEEYLLSILNLATKDASATEQDVDQPLFNDIQGPDDGGGIDEDEDEEDAGEGDFLPVAEIEPESVDFGVIDLGSDVTSITKEVVITNTGTVDLEIEAVSFEDPFLRSSETTVPVFKILSQPQFPIEPGQKDSILIEGSPEKSGVFSSSLVIETNEAAEKSSNNIPLSLEAYITPIDPEEFMNAQEAIDYLISLKDAPEEEHPTFDQMANLMSKASHNHFRADIEHGSTNSLPNGGGSIGNVGTADLLLFLGSYNHNYNTSDSFFTGDAVFGNGTSPTTIEGEGGDVPEVSGGMPLAILGVNFNSATEAINALLTRGDMTAAQFHFLNTFINKKVSHDFDGNGVVGTNDLLDLLQAYEITTVIASDLAFISANPLDLTSQPGPLEGDSSSDIISWILIDGSMTASEYWYLASFVKKEVKCDVNGDGIVGTADHLSLLNEWTLVQEDNTFTPYDGNDSAFS